MLQALGLFAVITTLMISFNNPRAVIWLGLGSLKVLLCSVYDVMGLSHVVSWAPDAVFVSVIGTAIFIHIIGTIKVLDWELVLYRLACLSLALGTARFLGVPYTSEIYLPVMVTFYGFSLGVIFANSLVKSGILNGQNNKNIKELLQLMGCSSDKLHYSKGGAQRWL